VPAPAEAGAEDVTTAWAIDRIEFGAGDLTFSARACGPHDGRPVLLLHGFPQGSWAWREVLSTLGAAGLRAVAPDQRGYSRGARPTDAGAYATERLLDDVVAASDALGMERVDLVGHDWGGMLAWLLAARHPDRLRTLSVVSTPHPLALREVLEGPEGAGVAARATMARLADTDVSARRLLEPDGTGGNLAQLLSESGLDEDHTRRYVEAMREPGALEAALAWYRSMDAEVLGGLDAVRVPTLYVWSSGDRAFSREAAERSATHVEAAYRFEVLEGVSHWIPETEPDRLSALLVDHLLAH
jgi:pimeloyl-ACP methyl ester carboxylesterase